MIKAFSILLMSAVFLQCHSQTDTPVPAHANITSSNSTTQDLSRKMYSGQTTVSANITTEDLSLSKQVAVSLAVVLLSLTTIIGNLLVILSVTIFRKLHTIPNMFVVSLATADLIMGSVVIPLGLPKAAGNSWQLGHTVCTLWICIDVLSVTASIGTLCVIALDRYFAITTPFTYSGRVTRTRARITIGGIWLISIVISLMPFFKDLWTTGLEEDQKCWEDPTCCEFRPNLTYTIVSSIISFYIPCFVMIFSYSIVFKTALKQRSKIQNSEGVYRRASMPGSKALLWSKREYRAVFTMGMVMGTFVLCWLPFFVLNIVQSLCNRCIPMKLFENMNQLGYLNSFFNPLIYCHSREFRTAFKKIIGCSLCKIGYQRTARASLSAGHSPSSTARSSVQSSSTRTSRASSFFQSAFSRFSRGSKQKESSYSSVETSGGRKISLVKSNGNGKNSVHVIADTASPPGGRKESRQYGRFYKPEEGGKESKVALTLNESEEN